MIFSKNYSSCCTLSIHAGEYKYQCSHLYVFTVVYNFEDIKLLLKIRIE